MRILPSYKFTCAVFVFLNQRKILPNLIWLMKKLETPIKTFITYITLNKSAIKFCLSKNITTRSGSCGSCSFNKT